MAMTLNLRVCKVKHLPIGTGVRVGTACGCTPRQFYAETWCRLRAVELFNCGTGKAPLKRASTLRRI